jgi:glycosyltransferase involved in cell wall biosynthesis
MGYPRLLLVSSSLFNPFSGGGITLTNLFKGWPENRIAAVHTETYPLDTTICSHNYALVAKELGWFWPLNHILSARKLGRENSNNAEITANNIQNTIAHVSVYRRIFRFVNRLIANEGFQDYVTVTAPLKRWVTDFQPDIIYTLLGSLGYMRLVRELVNLTGAKLVIHMMDDWPSVRYRQGVLSGIFRRQMEIELNQIIKNTTLCMGISPAMCKAYQQRYGREFFSYSNALDMAVWMRFAKQDWQRNDPVEIMYSGAILNEAQLSSLLDICRAVEALNQQGLDVVFSIHTPQPFRDVHQTDFDDFSHTSLNVPLNNDDVAGAMSAADILALPVNFDRHTRRYVRYSNPTKIPAYMISGTPILAYGPLGVDQIDRAERDGWGYVVSDQGVENVVSAIRELVQSPALREKIGREAQHVAQRDHDIITVSRSFQEKLKRAAI